MSRDTQIRLRNGPRVTGALPDIFEHGDCCKEVGVVLISAWFHATARICERTKALKSIPPVLLSTVTMLVGLNIVNGGQDKAP